MKKLGFLFIFLLGAASYAFAQVTSEQKSTGISDSLLTDQFSKRLPLQITTPKTLLVDSTHVFIPRSLYTERLLTLPKETKFRVGLPLVELPDPQSRMPIRGFDDSVNYTILKKDY